MMMESHKMRFLDLQGRRLSTNTRAISAQKASTDNNRTEDVCCSKCTKAGMEWDKYKPSPVVKDYAAVSTQNSKFRKYMEDECVALPKYQVFHGDPALNCFFGVYDGHGGGFCSKYAASNFHHRLAAVLNGKVGTSRQRESELSNQSAPTSSSSTELSDAENNQVLSGEDIENGYAEAFAALDQELEEFDEASNSGSTAVTCLIRKSKDRTTFHVANVGDSRAILYSGGVTTRLSVDHKATNEDEAKRIRDNNGIIFNKRVGGIISVTRALGQIDEKEFIIAQPYTTSHEVRDGDAFLVLASDGISDVFKDEELTEYVLTRLNRGEKAITICKRLLDEAKNLGAMDNMTVVLICLSGDPPQRHRHDEEH
ncbi:hypothetical protein Poli38472_004263 [Pythium oligandrum]|uniref:protein-serine/threonine phosphatase n=1 Tax=Pythium oligandrum TaxID=41045 RepID=A0A8K1CP77_PYTOL|nr:hypothetical protein Poli38472_004263 [Pythium oligandrum]|eukprot:TMW66498.1 hypothetical protein Poli38472_004263 [Pythium oligandrum]